MKQLMAGAGVAIVGMVLVPLLSGCSLSNRTRYPLKSSPPPRAQREGQKGGLTPYGFLIGCPDQLAQRDAVGGIMGNLTGMFDSVNQQVADIATQGVRLRRGERQHFA